MKQLLLILLIVLTIAAGCINVAPKANDQKPTAYIDVISPAEVSPGVTVNFEGHGTDPASAIVAYRWRSNLDGELSVKQHFDTSSLSEGVHTVYFKVQNEKGSWSEEVTAEVTISSEVAADMPPGAPSEPIITSFIASPESITLGDPSTLSWTVTDATTVTLDQGIGDVALTGSRTVSPDSSTIFTLTATNAAGSVTASAQVIVLSVPPPSPTPAPGLPDLIIEDVMRSGSTISYKIKNNGDANAGATISELVIDSSIKANDQVDPLAAGASRDESFAYSYTCTDPSDSIVVRADKDNVVTESNEGNNEHTESWNCIAIIEVIPGPVVKLKPDLIITDIWKVSEITGDKIYYKIKNVGLGSSDDSMTALRFDPTIWPWAWATDNVGTIGPGVEVTRKFATYNWTGIGSKVVVTADYDGVVAETEEGNNSREEPTSGL